MQDYSYKNIWKVSYPVLLSLLAEHLISMTDTAFLGRVGEIELGASAIGGVYFLAIYMLGFGFSLGSQIVIARRNGEGKLNRIGAIFSQGILFMLLLAVILFTISKLFTSSLLDFAMQSEEVYHTTIQYLDWRLYGLFFAFTALMFRAFFIGTASTRILTINAIVILLTNVGLNYILIFGKLGLPALGIKGAAIASSMAEAVSVMFYIMYSASCIRWKIYGGLHFLYFNVRLLFQILKISVWMMLQSFLSVSTWFIFFLMVERLGERQLAIIQLVRNISSLPFLLISSFATTCNALVSNAIGAGYKNEVWTICMRVIKMVYVVVLPIILAVFLIPQWVLRIYTDNAELINSAIPTTKIMASAFLITVPSVVLFNAVSGTGNTSKALLIEFTILIVYILSVVYIVGYLRADVAVCWLTEHIYGLGLFTLCYWYMRKGHWQRKVI
ncbi:MAG: MATE family efflux transporter [Prevotellaceae bacterium]|jgi:putative MATE family efflux protein|nr:MATE family efflux transporter [Prevotellaceae bacterium]